MPVRTGVLAEWRQRFGADCELLTPFLQPTGAVASALPCGGSGEACVRQIVVHPDGEIVGVCGAEGGECETLTLAKTDLAIHEFDALKFGAHLAAVLGLVGKVEAIPRLPSALRLGDFVPFACERFPAFLVFQRESADEFAAAIERLVRRALARMVLVISSTKTLSHDERELLQQAGAVVLALDEVLLLDGSTDFHIAAVALLSLSALREHAVSGAETKRRLLVPPGATWGDLKITCVDGHTVRIDVLGTSVRKAYGDLGMADGRSKNPNRQWGLLQEIIDAHGHLPDQRSEKQKKQRIALAKQLKEYFGIDGEPFESDGRGGWRARFRVASS